MFRNPFFLKLSAALLTGLVFCCAAKTVLSGQGLKSCEAALIDLSGQPTTLYEFPYLFSDPLSCFVPYSGPKLGSLDQRLFDAAPLEITADQTTLADVGLSTFSGNVRLKKDKKELLSPFVTLLRPEDIATATQGFKYQEPGLEAIGETATSFFKTNEFSSKDVTFRIPERHARGSAQTFYQDQAKNTKMTKATYTTCMPSDDDWLLKAETLLLNPTTGWGEAKNASLSSHGIPLFYAPFYRFPIDDRRHTGFLTPRFQMVKQKNEFAPNKGAYTGVDIAAPFYWDLHPQADLMLTPRVLSERGVQLASEFRYLQSFAHGLVKAEFLPDDKLANNNRHFLHLENTSRLNDHWLFDLTANQSSDRYYFEDLGDEYGFAKSAFIDQQSNLTYESENSAFLAQLQGYQILDSKIALGARPYRLLPKLVYNYELPQQFGLDWNLGAELVRFTHADVDPELFEKLFDPTVSRKTTRTDLSPSVSFPLEASYGLIQPKLTIRSTRYALDKALYQLTTVDDVTTKEILTPASLHRVVPLFSLDSRLFLEKELTLFQRPYLQTLEPRLFYLRVPYRDQSKIPLFDTALPPLNYDQIFRENRFIGKDRVGDANLLGFGLTTRLLEGAGLQQKATASVGQIKYFDKRRVKLSRENTTDPFSHLIGAVSYQILDHWKLADDLEINPYKRGNKVERNTLSVQYQKGVWRWMQAGFTLERAEQPTSKQVNLGLLWPVSENWLGMGRWYYDFTQRRALDSFAGFEYNSCCWAVRFVAQREFNPIAESLEIPAAYDFRFFFQVELKGLGTLGQKSDIISLIQKTFPSYNPPPSSEFRYNYE